jgi:5-hydroxyisourate hydrolase-like protein (transthyretin family)
MIPLALLLAILAATPDTAKVTMSIDLQHPHPGSRVTLELRSLRDGTVTEHEQIWPSIDLLQEQSVPPGSYDLTIAAPGHRPVTRRLVAAAGETVSLGAITLRSLPRITGRITANGVPVANATIRATKPAIEARTDKDGSFALEVMSRRPRFLIAEAPGLGTRTVDVPQTDGDSQLPAIELEPPSSVEITVRRPQTYREPLEVQLGVQGRGTMYWLTGRTLEPRRTKATFNELGAGAYVVLVRGKGPMQQLAAKVVLGHNEHRRMTMVIEPVTIAAYVRMGGQPLPNATAMLMETDESTMTRVTTDAGGRWEGEVWQPSEYVVRVYAPGVSVATTHAKFDHPQVTIDLPAHVVRGRVLDAQSGEPVRGASLSLRTEWEDKAATAALRTDGEGRFIFRGVQPGQQKLAVRANGYLLHDNVQFELPDDVPVQELDEQLDPGVRREASVRDRHGAPIARANVLCGDEEHVRSSAITDEEGRALMPLPRDGCTIYVIPEGTSFAQMHITRAMIDRQGALPISLSETTGRLEVVTQTDQGQPVGGVRLLVRYNGYVVPPEVARAIERVQGLAFRTDDGGVATLPGLPVGTYELWPYRTEHEAAQILAASSALEAPIQLTLETGDNRVSVKLRTR